MVGAEVRISRESNCWAYSQKKKNHRNQLLRAPCSVRKDAIRFESTREERADFFSRKETARTVVGRRGKWCPPFVRGRSHMTIDPRIPTMLGRSTSGFHQPRRHGLHQARSAVRCTSSRMKRAKCILPRTTRYTDVGTLYLLSCFWMTAPMSHKLFSGVATPETAMGNLLCKCFVGALPYSHYVMRSFPLCGVRVLHTAQHDPTRQPSWWPPKKQTETNGTLVVKTIAHAVIGMFTASLPTSANPNIDLMFYRVGADRDHPLYTHCKGVMWGGGEEERPCFKTLDLSYV